MSVEEQFSQLASLIGEPARAKMLWHLLDGRAFTATELSLMAEVSPQSASMHLNKLMQARLLTVEHQGRHRYYKFASRDVAYAIEAIANLIPLEKTDNGIKSGGGRKPEGSGKAESFLHNGHIKYCRSCYDHLAGKMGVAITDRLVKNQLIIPENNTDNIPGTKNPKITPGYQVTPAGFKWFTRLEINIEELKAQRRTFSRQCLDWSERRSHIAGSLGAALLDKMLKEDWVRKIKYSRALLITGKGEKTLTELLGPGLL